MDTYLYFLMIVCLLSFFTIFKKNVFFDFFLLLVVISFCGLRFFSGADYEPYYFLFKDIPNLFDFSLKDFTYYPFEPLFLLINSFVKIFTDKPFLFLFFLSFFSVLSKYIIASKFSDKPALVIFMYLSLFYFSSEFVQIRWALSLSFIFYSIYLYLQGWYKSTLIFLLLASLIQITSVFVLLFFCFIILFKGFFKNLTIIRLLFFSFSSFILSLFFDLLPSFISLFSILSNENYFVIKLLGYLNSADEQITYNVIIIMVAPYLAITFLLLFIESHMGIQLEKFYFDVYKIYSLLLSMCLLTTSFYVFSQRIFLIPHFLSCVLLVYLIKKSSSKYLTFVSYFIVASCFSIFWLASFLSAFKAGNIWSYDTWFFNWIY